jgi:antitoxin component of RelBE/YafQ-DinJ toxin-antitoxin module
MVALTKEVKKKLRRVAERLDMTMAGTINYLLNKWLEEHK